MTPIPTLLQYATRIADRAVIADIESEGTMLGDHRWDISAMLSENECSAECIDMTCEALQYGLARGLLQLEDGPGHVVRILKGRP